MTDTPARLRFARLAAGMTQAQLGAAVGVTHTAVHRWETGAAISTTRAADCCRVLKVSADWLLSLSEDGGPTYRAS